MAISLPGCDDGSWLDIFGGRAPCESIEVDAERPLSFPIDPVSLEVMLTERRSRIDLFNLKVLKKVSLKYCKTKGQLGEH